MYAKDKTTAMHLRLSQKDMDFLLEVSELSNLSVSEVTRQLISSSRRTYEIAKELDRRDQ